MSAACPRCEQELLVSAVAGHYCPGGCGWLNDDDEFVEFSSNGHARVEMITNEPPAVEPGEILEELVGFVRRFVCMTEHEAVAVALWTFHTHAISAAQATPYIAITSAEKESGKTLLLEVLNLLVANPWLTGRATAAVLPRKIDADRPSLLLDESDTAFKGDRDYAEALRGVLNSGYRRSGKTTVCVGQGTEIGFKDFSTFCPKAIAGIGRLPDTVQSRSIPIRLKRKAPGESVERFRERDATEQARPLRDALELMALSLVSELAPARPVLPDELGDRAQDVWEPLLAIADAAGESWAKQAREAAVELSAGAAPEDDSAGVRLLADIKSVLVSEERVGTAVLLEALHDIEDAPWGDWYGKPMTARALAKLLRPYAIAPHSDGKARGYSKEQFEDAWTRYLPPATVNPSESQSQSEKQPISTRQSENSTDTFELAANPHQDWDPDGLTLSDGGEGS
jgi:Protein of unknown function (DUF3631)